MLKNAPKPLLHIANVMCRFFTNLKKGKIVEKKCNCGKTYKDHSRIEKRYIPVCNDCLPF